MKKKILSEEYKNISTIEQELVKLLNKALHDKLIELAEEDIKKIAREVMPDLDKIIANKIKEHFYQIGNFLIEKFGDTGE